LIGVLLVAEWLSITGSGSFPALLSFLGVIALPVISGFFPILLLVATRRKGDYVPALVPQLIGSPILLTSIYLLYMAMIFTYAFVIWQTTPERVATLIAGLAVVGVTFAALRGTAVRPRLVVEVRIDEARPTKSCVNVIEDGKPCPTPVILRNRYDGETRLDSPVTVNMSDTSAIHLQSTPARASELKVWAHRLTAEGASVSQVFALDIAATHTDAVNGSVLLPCQPGHTLDILITLAVKSEL
jgi:hypothetical protein